MIRKRFPHGTEKAGENAKPSPKIATSTAVAKHRRARHRPLGIPTPALG